MIEKFNYWYDNLRPDRRFFFFLICIAIPFVICSNFTLNIPISIRLIFLIPILIILIYRIFKKLK